MLDEDAPDEGGLEPADDEETTGVADEGAVDEAPPETYTREQLAELLGPRFERFASHEGDEAFRQFGSAYDQATSLIGQGAHLEPQDASVYQQLGIDPPPQVEAPQEDPRYAYWAPVDQPTNYEELDALAGHDPRKAAEFALSHPTMPDDMKARYFAHWQQHDPAGVESYRQATLQQSMEQRVEAMLSERIAPLQEQYEQSMNVALDAQATQNVPGYAEHKQEAFRLMMEHANFNKGYADAFVAAPLPVRVEQIRLFVNAAAASAAPARQAANAAAADGTDEAKRRAMTEGRSGNASNNDPNSQSAAKQRSLEEMRRVGHLVN